MSRVQAGACAGRRDEAIAIARDLVARSELTGGVLAWGEPARAMFGHAAKDAARARARIQPG
jgi:hypothetical protein